MNECRSVEEAGRLNKEAIFDILVPGNVDGIDVLGKFRVVVLITAGLKPNMLLGTDFLKANGVTINYPRYLITIESYLGLTLLFEIVVRYKTVVRRVIIARKTVIPPRITAQFPVRYTALPNNGNYNYVFYVSLSGIADAILTIESPQIITFINISDTPVVILRNRKVG
jgi:hypothetical protein